MNDILKNMTPRSFNFFNGCQKSGKCWGRKRKKWPPLRGNNSYFPFEDFVRILVC